MNKKTSTLISMAISIALIAAGIWYIYSRHAAVGFHSRNWPFGHGAMMGNGMGMIMFLIWILVIIAVVALISGLLGSRGDANEAKASQEPLQILQRRYARGEIDRLEFEAKRQDLLNS